MNLKPTSTSYALLGLLSVRRWSAYELAQQMARSLGYCWQVAPSVVYHEPKRLVAMGYATVTSEQTGRRRRAVYQITPAGRDALRTWLATPPSAPQLQIEPMLRLLFADSGTPEDLAASLRELRAWAERLYAQGGPQVTDYLATGGPFPDRLDLIALFGEFFSQLYGLIIDWAGKAEADVATWPTTRGPGLSPHTRQRLQTLTADLTQRGLPDNGNQHSPHSPNDRSSHRSGQAPASALPHDVP